MDLRISICRLLAGGFLRINDDDDDEWLMPWRLYGLLANGK